MKKIQALQSQSVQLGTQELAIRQRELETKVERMLTTSDLPSFGHDGSSKSLISLESRLMAMENSGENLVTEKEVTCPCFCTRRVENIIEIKSGC